LSPDFIRDNILLFGPGFVFVKLVYLFGEQHRRLEWEWLVWSLVAGVPIAYSAEWWVSGAIPAAIPSVVDPAHAVARFAIAIVAAVVLIVVWRVIRHSGLWPIRFLRRSLSDSAWDLVLDKAVHDGCGVAVTVERTDDAGNKSEASFYGFLGAFGYEAAAAEPVVFLRWVSRWDPTVGESGSYVRLSRAEGEGMIFHRDKILRMRLVAPDEPRPSRWTRLKAWLRPPASPDPEAPEAR
jgi:hypothetical protein